MNKNNQQHQGIAIGNVFCFFEKDSTITSGHEPLLNLIV